MPTAVEPFQYPAFLILSSLADGAKHGYAIIEDIEACTGIRLGPGTLYGALARLEKAHYIEGLPTKDRRRPYQLTRQGEASLRCQCEQWGRFVAIGRERLAPQ